MTASLGVAKNNTIPTSSLMLMIMRSDRGSALIGAHGASSESPVDGRADLHYNA
jgi:hypothetical protein